MASSVWVHRLFPEASDEFLAWQGGMEQAAGRPICVIPEESSFHQQLFEAMWDSMKDAAVVERYFNFGTTEADKRTYEYMVCHFITENSTLLLKGVDGLNRHTIIVNGKTIDVNACGFCNEWWYKTKLCSGCRQVRYCQEFSCQKDHWAAHRLVCPRLDKETNVIENVD